MHQIKAKLKLGREASDTKRYTNTCIYDSF